MTGKLKEHFRSLSLNLFGITTLLLGGITQDSQFTTYAIIFFTGAMVTSAVENKK